MLFIKLIYVKLLPNNPLNILVHLEILPFVPKNVSLQTVYHSNYILTALNVYGALVLLEAQGP